MSDSGLDAILAAAKSLTLSESSPASLPGVAVTPVCRAPARKGGAMIEGTAPAKLFSVIYIDCSDTSYCFGVIGNGSAFCIKKNCSVQTHTSVKMLFTGLERSFVFIRRNIPGSVFSEPKLSTSKIPADIMSEWESKKLTTTDWLTEFQAIDGTSEVLASAEEIQTESDFLAESSLLRTPGRRKKDSSAGEEFEGPLPSWMNPRYERTLPEDPQALEALLDEGVLEGTLSTTVAKIETYIVDMGYALEEATSLHHDRLCTLEDNLEVMIGMIQTLKSRVGSSVDIGERFTAPTLWGSTACIADELTKVSEDMVALKKEMLKPVADIMKQVDILNAKVKRLENTWQEERLLRFRGATCPR